MPNSKPLLQHDICVLRDPNLESAALAILSAGTEIRPISQRDGFVQIGLPANQQGYIPGALCSSSVLVSQPALVRLIAPSALYATPDMSADPRILLQPVEQFQVVRITFTHDHSALARCWPISCCL